MSQERFVHINEMRVSGNTASCGQQWIKTIKHHHMDDAQQAFRIQCMQVLATTFSDTAVDFRKIDYNRPTAIILGNKHDGVSQQGIDAADQLYHYPYDRHGTVTQCLSCFGTGDVLNEKAENCDWHVWHTKAGLSILPEDFIRARPPYLLQGLPA